MSHDQSVQTRTGELAIHVNLTEHAASNNSSVPQKTMRELEQGSRHILTCLPPRPASPRYRNRFHYYYTEDPLSATGWGLRMRSDCL